MPLPLNTMQGLTVTLKDRLKDMDEIILHASLPRPFLSIEPIMGSLPRVDYSMFEHIIVGAMTGCGKDNVIPKREWIESIRENCPAEKVHWKDNIKKYL
jgi:protein gp37